MTINELNFLIGEWKGTGFAEYPTIDPVEYLESLVISGNNKNPVLHYEQKTFITKPAERNGEPIFWESGFIIDDGNGLFKMVNTQVSGRIETLKGNALKTNEGKVELELKSTSIINDDKLIKSGRKFIFSKDNIEYELNMSTTKNPAYQQHLSAKLYRV